MKFTETGFNGLYIVEPLIHKDNRGYFMESFNKDSFKKSGISFEPVQDNESRSVIGVIRGLHYQLKPYDQAKLIRVIEGKIYDVALDLRKDSRTFGKWFGLELDSENKKFLFIPRGFAHGFSVLSTNAVIQYKCDNFYNRGYDRGISLTDPSIAIDWKTDMSSAIISDKDRNNPTFENAEMNF